jgi:hypothetical protein
MKFLIFLSAVLILAVSAEQVNKKPILKPLSEELINYVNKIGTTWIVIKYFIFKINNYHIT